MNSIIESLSINEGMLNSGTLSSEDSVAMAGLNILLIIELEDLMQIAQPLKSDIYDFATNSADEIYAEVTSISDNDLIEYNFRIVYEIYLSTVAKGIYEFSAQQLDDLFNIATQCPDVGGEAVIDARILYDRVNPEMDYDDEIVCLPYGYFRTEQLASQSQLNKDILVFEMYPNPAKEKVRITYSISNSSVLSFYSITGQEVFSKELESGSFVYEINTSMLPEGAYSWKLETNSNTKNGKLFIIK